MQPHDYVLVAGLAVAALAWFADHLFASHRSNATEAIRDH